MWLVLHVNVDVSSTSEWFQSIKIQPVFIDALYSGAIGAFLFGDQTYNPVLWTMQIELFGSLVIYFACFLQQKKLFKILFIIISIVLSAFISAIAFLGIISFIIGHFLYFYQKQLPETFSIFLCILGLYFCGAHNDSLSYSYFSQFLGHRTYEVLNFLGGFCIVLATLKSNIINNALDKKILIYLGKLSFAIYLIHIAIIYIIRVPIFNYLLNYNLSFASASLITIPFVFAATLICSHFYSKYIDDFSIKFSSKLYQLLK